MNKLELIKKVKALADRGDGGEKENAQALLEELMSKYNIKDEDIQDEVIKDFDIKLPKTFNAIKLASQVFYSIVGSIERGKKGFYSYTYNRKREHFIRCTTAEYLEYEAKFKFYLSHFSKELELFYAAFIQANKIFPPADKTTESDYNHNFTDEDVKILNLARGIEKHDYRLQIEQGGKR